SLYTMDHPAVKGTIQESHQLLTSLLLESRELTLSVHEKKFLVNGKPTEVPETSLRPFVLLLNNFGMHSLTFLPGVAAEELIPFFNLASKGDAKKLGMDPGAYLASQNVTHIKVNLAKYRKMGENEVVGQGGIGGGQGLGDGGGEGADKAFIQELS